VDPARRPRAARGRRLLRLLRGLPGIATNLLADRLRQLEDDGLVARGDGRVTRYGLTARGKTRPKPCIALVRWGAPDRRGAATDEFRPEWLVVAPASPNPRAAGRLGSSSTARARRGSHTSHGCTRRRPRRRDVETDAEGALALAPEPFVSLLSRFRPRRCDHPRRAATMLHALAATGTSVGGQAATPVSAC
jgi:hypothetical protein